MCLFSCFTYVYKITPTYIIKKVMITVSLYIIKKVMITVSLVSTLIGCPEKF